MPGDFSEPCSDAMAAFKEAYGAFLRVDVRSDLNAGIPVNVAELRSQTQAFRWGVRAAEEAFQAEEMSAPDVREVIQTVTVPLRQRGVLCEALNMSTHSMIDLLSLRRETEVLTGKTSAGSKNLGRLLKPQATHCHSTAQMLQALKALEHRLDAKACESIEPTRRETAFRKDESLSAFCERAVSSDTALFEGKPCLWRVCEMLRSAEEHAKPPLLLRELNTAGEKSEAVRYKAIPWESLSRSRQEVWMLPRLLKSYSLLEQVSKEAARCPEIPLPQAQACLNDAYTLAETTVSGMNGAATSGVYHVLDNIDAKPLLAQVKHWARLGVESWKAEDAEEKLSEETSLGDEKDSKDKTDWQAERDAFKETLVTAGAAYMQQHLGFDKRNTPEEESPLTLAQRQRLGFFGQSMLAAGESLKAAVEAADILLKARQNKP